MTPALGCLEPQKKKQPRKLSSVDLDEKTAYATLQARSRSFWGPEDHINGIPKAPTTISLRVLGPKIKLRRVTGQFESWGM